MDYEVCAIQPPGREDRHREPPFQRMAPLVAMAADALESVLDLPYALFGHSLGALTAFEVARELRRRGLPAPVRLFVSSRMAPQLAPRFSSIHGLAESEFVEQLALRYGPIPPLILADPELMALFVPVLRSDIEILETYTYRAEDPLAMAISVFSWCERPGGGRDGGCTHGLNKHFPRRRCAYFPATISFRRPPARTSSKRYPLTLPSLSASRMLAEM